ncbi:zinc finger protein 271-like [Sitophilus oryzae]|uniref:Zinc finger protein 271-like n=1 Tax=Sitophilus oryzae TaxID=7048 RepID=A0A6J2X6X5_SITOR|nr:zinc finger protein 271-like [Sitophilus oryzae]
MEVEKLLFNSTYCRLCCTENENGINLFSGDDNSEEVCNLINRYLPLKVTQEDPLPKTICPGCHIQLETTKLFMDLIIEGQDKFRILLKAEQDLLEREEKEKKELEKALHHHNPNASVETYTIQTDENGEKFIIQIYSKGPLFSPEHELVLKADGLGKPKKKRGRPPKPSKQENSHEAEKIANSVIETNSKDDTHETVVRNDRKKRKIRAPARYDGVVQGAELDHFLKKEGVLDEVEEVAFTGLEKTFTDSKVQPLEIGKILSSEGQDLGQSVFSNRKSSKKRMKRKLNRMKYTCDICSRKFLHLDQYELHRKDHKVMYACQEENCQMRSENKDIILNHQKETNHHGIALSQEDSCNGDVILDEKNKLNNIEVTSNLLTTEEEQKNTTDEKKFKCPKCDKNFSCKQSYEVHIKAIHDGEKPFKCDICERTFAYAYSLKYHMISHKNKDNLDQISCDQCDKVFNHVSSVVYHKDTEHGNPKFICNTCNKTFKHRQLLQRHQLVHTDERPHKCSACPQAFKTKSNLINHEIIHSRHKRFICPICGQGFGHKTSLTIHLRWHEGTKPYECDICHKTFSQKGNLLEHKRIHTGEKPFCCDLCGKSFTTSSQWKLHRKRHTGEKPFLCQYCQKRFLHKDTYNTHIRRHLNIRPYKCKFCSRAFAENWACSRHEKLHLGEKRYKCETCGKAFADVSNFSKHRRIHTNNLENINLINTVTNMEIAKENCTTSGSMEVENLPVINSNENTLVNKTQIEEIVTSNLQIQEVLDNEGNPINFTTADGQLIPIVSSDSKNLQGLMPDGTLVSLDILPNQIKDIEPQPIQSEEINLLNTEIQFLENNLVTSQDDALSQEKTTFISEDGNVCFITSFDENAFLAIS